MPNRPTLSASASDLLLEATESLSVINAIGDETIKQEYKNYLDRLKSHVESKEANRGEQASNTQTLYKKYLEFMSRIQSMENMPESEGGSIPKKRSTRRNKASRTHKRRVQKRNRRNTQKKNRKNKRNTRK
jgi:hypothetical protein